MTDFLSTEKQADKHRKLMIVNFSGTKKAVIDSITPAQDLPMPGKRQKHDRLNCTMGKLNLDFLRTRKLPWFLLLDRLSRQKTIIRFYSKTQQLRALKHPNTQAVQEERIKSQTGLSATFAKTSAQIVVVCTPLKKTLKHLADYLHLTVNVQLCTRRA